MFRFLSLGGDCQPTVQINRTNGTFPALQFFDVVGCPIRGTIDLIANDFRDLLLTENLLPVYQEETLNRVIDLRYNLHLLHDFAHFTPEEIAAAQANYALRARWFMELYDEDETPVYYVRRWHPLEGAPEDESQAMELFEVLRSKRRDIRFLYLHRDPGRRQRVSGAYRSAYLAPREPYHWTGNDDAWRELLTDFAVRDYGDPDDTGFPLASAAEPRPKATPRFEARSSVSA